LKRQSISFPDLLHWSAGAIDGHRTSRFVFLRQIFPETSSPVKGNHLWQPQIVELSRPVTCGKRGKFPDFFCVKNVSLKLPIFRFGSLFTPSVPGHPGTGVAKHHMPYR